MEESESRFLISDNTSRGPSESYVQLPRMPLGNQIIST
jgi:hypothetical protein